MNATDFRRIALSLDGAEDGNLMLTPEQQTEFVEEQPDLFFPISGGWGRMGMTHIRLERANEDILVGALRTAWRLRLEKNEKARNNRRKEKNQK